MSTETQSKPMTNRELKEHLRTMDSIPDLERMYIRFCRRGDRPKVVLVRNRINRLIGFTKYR